VQDALDFRAGGIRWRPCEIDGVQQGNAPEPGQKQQGDVNCMLVGAIPDGFEKVEVKTVLSDESQMRHSITGGVLHQKGSDQSVQYWEIESSEKLVHPEHGEVEFGAGIWRLWPVVEYDHINDMVAAVVD
jgi:hypothetical protein